MYFSLTCFQEKQARIASLYLPLYGLILDNMPRFFLRELFPICFTSSDQVRATLKNGVYNSLQIMTAVIINFIVAKWLRIFILLEKLVTDRITLSSCWMWMGFAAYSHQHSCLNEWGLRLLKNIVALWRKLCIFRRVKISNTRWYFLFYSFRPLHTGLSRWRQCGRGRGCYSPWKLHGCLLFQRSA